ncbi:MAG: cytochrome c oxidase assembly protein [Pseudomonadota bacterium]
MVTKEEYNRRTAIIISAVVLGMLGMSFAAVPAYRAFCQITGWGGVTQRADAAPREVLDRKITVRFDATVGAGLNWRFKPEQLETTLQIGEAGLAFYEAENRSNRPVVGRATYNVSPAKAGVYFSKIECFCFTEQLLKPGEKVSMPLTFYVDPKLDEDRNLDEVQTITLSYTFFPWDDPEETQIAALQ